MAGSLDRVCEYSTAMGAGIETMDEFMQKTVPIVKNCLEEFAQKYSSKVVNVQSLAVCKHKKKFLSDGYRIKGTGYLKAANVNLESPTLKIDPDVEDKEDEFFRSGAVFMDEKGHYHIVEYYNSAKGYYAVDRGTFSPEKVATLFATAYTEKVGIHSRFFLECFSRKIEEAKGFFM